MEEGQVATREAMRVARRVHLSFVICHFPFFIREFNLEVRRMLFADTAKRLRPKNQGCFNPGLSDDSNIER
jgi:hypothetical protein